VALVVAAAEWKTLKSQGIGTSARATVTVPASAQHAYDTEGDRLLCGADHSAMKKDESLPWRPKGLGSADSKCPECIAASP
jgi:hypothetical protein